MSNPAPPPGWFADPMGRHELRYWDGGRWTDHVTSNGQQLLDPVGAPVMPVGDQTARQVQQQVQEKAVAQAAWQGGGHLLTEPILVVNQKAKVFELNNEYAIYDQQGRQIGAVRQVGQSAAKKALRVLTSLDQFMTHKLQVVDGNGAVMLALTRPAKVFKSTIVVENAATQEIGRIVQQNMVGKIRFALEAGGHLYGSINAENWRAWDFNVQDHTGAEIARITKTFVGLAKAVFTTADNYVVQIHRPLDEPLRSLVVAAAVSVDTALKQDARGFN
jgi:uncharacterized protein YxjI